MIKSMINLENITDKNPISSKNYFAYEKSIKALIQYLNMYKTAKDLTFEFKNSKYYIYRYSLKEYKEYLEALIKLREKLVEFDDIKV